MSNLFFSFYWLLSLFSIIGFGCINAGSVRETNSLLQLTLTITIFSISILILWCLGFSLIYNDVDKYIGKIEFGPYINLLSLDYIKTPFNSGLTNHSFLFYHIILGAITQLIVIGTLAERVKPFILIIISLFLITIIYPVCSAWTWGGGWLYQLGYMDMTGTTTVCLLGGWSALTASIAIGPRINRFSKNNGLKLNSVTNNSLIGIGSIFLLFGWLGINNMPNVLINDNLNIMYSAISLLNTLISGSAAVFVCLITSLLFAKKLKLRKIIHSAIIGVISISADPLSPSPEISLIIGALAGLILYFFAYIIDTVKIDDATGYIPVFLLGGIWSTIAVCISNKNLDILIQVVGLTSFAVISIIGISIILIILKHTLGLRPKYDDEVSGYQVL